MENEQKSDIWLYEIRSSKTFIYTVVNLAVFIDCYVYTVIIPVLPFALTEIIHIEPSKVQWWTGALLAAFGVGLLVGSPIIGHYADRTGSRKWPYLFGLVTLLLSTIAFSFGRTMWILVVGRLMQGLSSASVHAVGMAILADTAGEKGLGPAMGMVTVSIAAGMTSGPLIGGILYHQLGYMSVFVSSYALVVLDFVFRLMMIERKASDDKSIAKRTSNDYGTFNGSINSPNDRPTEHGETQPEPSSSPTSTPSPTLCASNNSSMVSLLEEKLARHPILVFLSAPRMWAALLGELITSLLLSGLEAILPLRIKTVFHYNSQEVGLIFLLLVLPSIMGPLFGLLVDRVGAKMVLVTSYSGLLPLLIVLRFVDQNDQSHLALLCIILIVIGVCINATMTSVSSEIAYVVEDKSAAEPGVFGDKGAYASAFGLMNVAYAVGELAGPLLGGWLMDTIGWGWVTFSAGVLCGISVIPTALFSGKKRRGTKESVIE